MYEVNEAYIPLGLAPNVNCIIYLQPIKMQALKIQCIKGLMQCIFLQFK